MLKNRTLLGLLSIILAIILVFCISPLFNKVFEGKINVQLLKSPILQGQQITSDMLVSNNLILWAKALAFALLDITTKKKRKFSLIRFSTECRTRLFLPGQYTSQDVITEIEGFMHGGTDFEKPLSAVCQCISIGAFENADVIFITDGISYISNSFADYFRTEKHNSGLNVRGVLLGADAGGSMLQFCDKIYRLGDLGLDEIAEEIISDKI